MSATFFKYFDSKSDPRIERCKKHNLIDTLFLAISAVISGSEGLDDDYRSTLIESGIKMR